MDLLVSQAATRPVPKQARAVATRKKLLDGAVGALCELGYSCTTTTEICRRAGVSQGALYKHFGSKQELIATTTEHLFEGLIGSFRAALAIGADEDRVTRAIRELWAIFLTPELYAVLELYIAARTDEPLRQALAPVLLCHRANLLAEARTLFPEAAAKNPRFELVVDGVLTAMQGAALSVAVLPELASGPGATFYFEHLCRSEFEPPFGEE